MWFELLFKYPLTTYRQAELAFAGGVDPRWLAAGAAVGLLLLAASALRGSRVRGLTPMRRTAIFALQALVLLGVLALLTRPVLRVAEIAPGANTVVVLVDDSQSMALPADNGATHSRSEAARRYVSDLLPRLEPLADISLYAFGASAAPLERLEGLAADERRTRLTAALIDVLRAHRDAPLAAVILVSDGAENGHDLTADVAELAAAPLHAVGVGAADLAGDLELVDLVFADEAHPGSRIAARALVRHGAAEPAELKVWEGDALLAMRRLDAPPGQGGRPASSTLVSTEIEIDTGSPGLRMLRFELTPQSGEPIVENNGRARLLSVAPRNLHVLYLEGEPRWEYKFVRRAAERDPSLEVVSWLKTTPRKTLRQGIEAADQLEDGFPATLEELMKFELVILGSLPATALTREQHRWLEAFVARRGGSLLVLGGRSSLAAGGWDKQPLAAMLPVRLDGTERQAPAVTPAPARRASSVRPTQAGLASAITRIEVEGGTEAAWSTLPALDDVQLLGERKPGATVLLEALHEAGAVPLLVDQRYGRGRTSVLATSSTWRWQTGTDPDDDRHGRFWRQLLRQLAESAPPRSALHLEPTPDGDAVMARLQVRDLAFEPLSNARIEGHLTAARDGGTAETVPFTFGAGAVPGTYEARLWAAAASTLRVDASITTADGATEMLTSFIRPPAEQPEAFGAGQNRELLTRLADATGGRYWSLDEAPRLIDTLRLSSAGVTTRRHLDLWDAPAVFVLLLLLKCGEWLLRRRWGTL